MTYQVPQKATVAVVPAEEYEALKASHDRLLEAAKQAMSECCDLMETEAGNALGEAIKQAGGE